MYLLTLYTGLQKHNACDAEVHGVVMTHSNTAILNTDYYLYALCMSNISYSDNYWLILISIYTNTVFKLVNCQ